MERANQDHFFDILKSYQLPIDPDVRRIARKEVYGQPPVRHLVVYVVSFFRGTNIYVHSTWYGILATESDNESVDSDVSDGETDELLADLKEIHVLESHALDDGIEKTSEEDWI